MLTLSQKFEIATFIDMGKAPLIRDSDAGNIRIETKRIDLWQGPLKLGVVEFHTWRCRETGKLLSSAVEEIVE